MNTSDTEPKSSFKLPPLPLGDCGSCQQERVIWNENSAQEIARKLCRSCQEKGGVSYAGHTAIPEREAILESLKDLLELLFPGYTGKMHITQENQFFSTGSLLEKVQSELSVQIQRAFAYHCAPQEQLHCQQDCKARAESVCASLLMKLPQLREILLEDVQAALDGDPATKSMDEVILAYPGFRCICIHRLAHELYQAKVPLIPRVMSEYAHTITGIDINPGAVIGRHFFIDHGTGVVIGETAIIGDNVKLYQGVTLGALSFPKDSQGALIKGTKRHPNIEDNVTIYAESTILGNITIGHDSVIGGNTWVTDPVPPYSKVTIEPGELSIVAKRH